MLRALLSSAVSSWSCLRDTQAPPPRAERAPRSFRLCQRAATGSPCAVDWAVSVPGKVRRCGEHENRDDHADNKTFQVSSPRAPIPCSGDEFAPADKQRLRVGPIPSAGVDLLIPKQHRALRIDCMYMKKNGLWMLAMLNVPALQFDANSTIIRALPASANSMPLSHRPQHTRVLRLTIRLCRIEDLVREDVGG